MLGGVCDLCPAELRVRSSWRLGPGSDDEDKEGGRRRLRVRSGAMVV
jgi:hypothetical protein